ncbi:MAG: ATP-binding protein [Microscillaceae bacterium]|jgi:ABC-type multidrug transport system ATPase subunit|nr:ATP-binding protein [Microscillaceae bacterium]
MVLKSIKYTECKSTNKEWAIDEFSLNKINLIVGKNASGKTRTLNCLSNSIAFFGGTGYINFLDGFYEMIFEKDKETLITFELEYKPEEISHEKLIINNQIILERGKKGKGKILYSQMNQMLAFEIPKNQVACVAKRDKTQHPFLEDLAEWANNLRRFDFGADLGKNHFQTKTSLDLNEVDFQNTTQTVAQIYHLGYKKYKKSYTDLIINDLQKIGYHISKIHFSEVGQINYFPPINQANTVYGLAVQENDLKSETLQINMSQGMFRALSLLIQLNYYFLSGKNGCIVIDDIGEGLDYERAKSLIKLLIEKSQNSNIQLVMSTNDRFVMNNIPLEYWQIIHREGSQVKIINYENSKDIFDKFDYTGLDNFDFFTSQYYLKQAVK